MTMDSDIDLLVVAPTPGNRHEASVMLRDAIGAVDFPVDVILISTEAFLATKNVVSGNFLIPRTSTGKSSMKPPENEVRRSVLDWIGKTDLDLRTVTRLYGEEPFRDVVAFHAGSRPPRKYPEGIAYPASD